MALGWVLFENALETAENLSATYAADGRPVSNLLDWKTGLPYRWVSSSTNSPQYIEIDFGSGFASLPHGGVIDTVVMAGANWSKAFTGPGGWTLMRSSDGVTYTGVHTQAGATSSDLPRAFAFTNSTGYRYWRLQMFKSSGFLVAPQIGTLVAGRRLVWEDGPRPNLDPYGSQHRNQIVRNELGNLIGVNVEPEEKRFQVQYDSAGFSVSGFWSPASGITGDEWVTHAIDQGKPFWYCWDYDLDPSPWMCRMVNDEIRQPWVGTTARRVVDATFSAWRGVA